MAYKKVCALDLNYGQSEYRLQRYRKANPDVFMSSPVPRPGRQLVSVNDIMCTWDDSLHRYEWMQPFRPIGHVAHAYLIFDITPEQLKSHSRKE